MTDPLTVKRKSFSYFAKQLNNEKLILIYTYFHLYTYNKAFCNKTDIYLSIKCFNLLKSAPTIGSAELSSKSSGADRYDCIDV